MCRLIKRVAEIKRVNSKNGADGSLDVFLRARLIKFVFYIFIFSQLSLFSFFFAYDPALAADITTQKVIDLANADRAEKGIQLLEENDKLARVAKDKAEDMVAKNYFAHNSPEGVNPWHWFEKENYDYNYAGENLAMDFTSAEKMNQAWLDSPTHRANILNGNFKEIGVAVKEGIVNDHSTIVVVQLFGSGDKNSKDETPEKNLDKKEISENEKFTPLLPPALEIPSKKNAFSKPVITYPQEGKVISGKNIEVVGIAMPGARVTLFENSIEAGQSFADQKGWFRIKLDNLAEGGHKFLVTGDKTGGEKRTDISQDEIFFSVDRSKPKVDYHLYAGNDSQKYLLSLYSNKANCVFELNGMKIEAKERKRIFVTIPVDRIASALKVEDEAGNKSIKEINLVNYVQGEKKADLVNRLAGVFTPEKIFTADSGRDALKKNLGIAMERYKN
jgi:hypothetical protein